MNKLWHFLGGVTFACILLSLAALMVIVATFIEANTTSHKLAESIIYQSFFFKSLLIGFFINILISSLRRYPFKKKHLPFLITHLGLLMIIAGTFVKAYFGTQGSMAILEGGISDKLVLPQSSQVTIFRRAPSETFVFDPENTSLKNGDFSLRVIQKAPHGEEIFYTFFKDNFVHLLGFPPIEIGDTGKSVMALKSSNPLETFKEQAKKRLLVTLDDIPLPNVDIAEFDPLVLKLPNGKIINDQIQTSFSPLLLFVIDQENNTTIFSLDASGHITKEHLPFNSLKTVVLYEDGFEGVTSQVALGHTGYLLEAPITRKIRALSPPLKQEERRPIITLELQEGGVKEIKTLLFDPSLQGLKVSALYGKYLLHFGPKIQKLPHKVHVRRAFHIPYPGTAQPFSYEADLLVDDTHAHLSMNRVYESHLGYRFYLAGLQPKEEVAVKRVHLVINRDPTRWWLTFPGGALVALGIFLLFFWKRGSVAGDNAYTL